MTKFTPSLVERFARFTEARRLLLGLSTYAIEQAGGPGESTMRAVEAAKYKTLNLDTFVAVCKALDVDPATVLKQILTP